MASTFCLRAREKHYVQVPTLLQDNRRVLEKKQESRFFFPGPSFVTSELDVVVFLQPEACGLEDEMSIWGLFFCFFFFGGFCFGVLFR